MPTEHLILGDVDGIQDFVFSSSHLREMVGASLIVRELHEEVVPEVIGKFSSNGGSTDPDDFRIVRNSGGSLCLVVECECDADNEERADTDYFAHLLELPCRCPAHRLCDELRTRFADRSRGGRLSLTPPVPGGFEAFEKAKELLEHVKRRGGASAEPRMAPYFLRCSSCGLEPAVAEIEHRNIGFIGAQCRQKREVGDEKVGSAGDGDPWWFRDWKQRREQDGPVRSARHFEEIAGDGLLALVLADVDGLGAKSQDLLDCYKDEGPEKAQLAYWLLSLMLERRMRDAVASALSLVRIREDDDGDGDVLPAQVLLTGGDDVAVALPGASAFAVARAVSRAFRDWDLSDRELLEMAREDQGYSPTPSDGTAVEKVATKVVELSPGVSAAAVVTGAHFPIRDSREIAGGLLGRAKAVGRQRGWGAGGLHYAVVSEAAADLPALEESWTYGVGDGADAGGPALRLTGRPYRLTGSGDGGGDPPLRSAERFRNAVVELGKKDFPTNKLTDLRRLFSRVWLLDEGFPADPNEEDIEAARFRLEAEYRTWRQRVFRREEDAGIWRRVEGLLSLDDSGLGSQPSPWYPGGDESDRWRTPLPDLADAVDLWAT